MTLEIQEIKVGDKVRSHDFSMDDECYREGVVIAIEDWDGVPCYKIEVSKSVWQGVEDEKFPEFVNPPVNGTKTVFGRVYDGVEKI